MSLKQLINKPSILIFMSGAVFYALLNLFFKFHLIADDFSYQISYWANPNGASLSQVVGFPFAIRQPIYILQYCLILLSPNSTNLFYFLFHLVHSLNAVLIYRLVLKYLSFAFNNEEDAKRISFCAALLFLFFPGNYEVLYWRSCLFYTLGLSLVLGGLLRPGIAAFAAWTLSYVIYEAFLFIPLFLLIPIYFRRNQPSGDGLQLKKFLKIYIASLVVFGIWRIGSTALWGIEVARYPINFGFLGINVFKRVLGYMLIHFSIRSSMKDYELLSWLFRVLVLTGIWMNRSWIRENWKLLGALLLAYAVSLAPVSLIAHWAPRGSFPSTVLFAILIAFLVGRAKPWLWIPLLGLFILGHINGARKTDFNSRLYETRYAKIHEVVSALPDDAKSLVEVKNFNQGFKKEWFLQIGFSLKVFENELKQQYVEKNFSLIDACPERAVCTTLDFRGSES